MWTHSFVCGLAVVAVASPALAADLHVPVQYPTIQSAIDAAADGDSVIIADGLYTGMGNRNLTFAGKAITVRSANGPANCIIDCQASPEHPARGFHFNSGETSASVLDGLTITGGDTLPGAIADQFNGGAILCNNFSSPTVKNCAITGNNAACWGGSFCCTNASPMVVNCSFIDNTVGDDGGAFFAWLDSHPTLVNCLFAGNVSTSTGGAITTFGGGASTIINCTITDNEAPWGGGIYGFNTTVINSIVWNNTASNLNSEQIDGNSLLVTNTIVEGGYNGASNLDADPLFADPANRDYALLAGSPAIDSGDSTMLPDSVTTDLLGQDRIVDGNHDLVPSVDRGAIEHQPVCPTDLNGDGSVGPGDLASLLSAWGSNPGHPADADGDGFINAADLANMLSHWGACK